MSFIIEWIMFYIAIMVAMAFDNYCWIPADRKWYYTKEWKPHFKPSFQIGIREYFLVPQTKEGWKIVRSRIWAVLSHSYDIIPALISSFILAVIF